jgi:lipopolysaccharide/colanic/teichoic acid biosynthesis glycosyltransferase
LLIEKGGPGNQVGDTVTAVWAGARTEALSERVLRRALDISISATALVLLSPVLLAIAAVIRMESRGPVIFRQIRIGKDRRRTRPSAAQNASKDRRRRDGAGRPFVFYKFRTMYADARTRFPHLYTYTYQPEDLKTLPMKVLMGTKAGELGEDPRVPPMCRWLRRSSLDELPNLWNVLKGDMHLVGPRPDIPENLRYYQPWQMKKFEVKPGVTGLAQVRGSGRLPFDKTLAYDVEMVERRSLRLDVVILAQTASRFLSRDGAF